jgi:hypothetical protein
MFRRSNGAQVIVATPTLAQGLNLPAHIAILASDMRADPDDGGREALGAHELLNAAARAGRAGHLANGVVLLIPEDILTFSDGKPLTSNAVSKLASILPEDDRCLDMYDPLQTRRPLVRFGVETFFRYWPPAQTHGRPAPGRLARPAAPARPTPAFQRTWTVGQSNFCSITRS